MNPRRIREISAGDVLQFALSLSFCLAAFKVTVGSEFSWFWILAPVWILVGLFLCGLVLIFVIGFFAMITRGELGGPK